jgi:hypothetical protein
VLIAVFSLVFTIQRAQEEDQSKLRSELTSILRRITVLNTTEERTAGDQAERVALVGQARAIFPQLESVPAVYYRAVAQAMQTAYYYGDSLKFADEAARRAAEEGDIPEEIYARRVKAAVYVALKDSRRARSEYKLAVAASERSRGGPDHIAALEVKAVTLEMWGNQEIGFGDCARALKLLNSAVNVARSNLVLRSRWLTQIQESRDSASKRCA